MGMRMGTWSFSLFAAQRESSILPTKKGKEPGHGRVSPEGPGFVAWIYKLKVGGSRYQHT